MCGMNANELRVLGKLTKKLIDVSNVATNLSRRVKLIEDSNKKKPGKTVAKKLSLIEKFRIVDIYSTIYSDRRRDAGIQRNSGGLVNTKTLDARYGELFKYIESLLHDNCSCGM